MKLTNLVAVIAVVAATAACSDRADRSSNPPPAPFDSQLRTSPAQPTNCSPADSTCGSGIGNPSVQSPVEKHEQNVSPQ